MIKFFVEIKIVDVFSFKEKLPNGLIIKQFILKMDRFKILIFLLYPKIITFF